MYVGCIKPLHGLQIWVAEPAGREDLCTLVLAYLQGTVPHPPVDNTVNFYQAAKTAAVRPHTFHKLCCVRLSPVHLRSAKHSTWQQQDSCCPCL